jgi:VanZ family protein
VGSRYSLHVSKLRIVQLAIVLLTLSYAGVLLYPFKWQPPHLLNNGAQLSSIGLSFVSPGIAYTQDAPWLADAIDSNHLALAIHLRAFEQPQYGPARIFGISRDHRSRNMAIGQSGTNLVIRVRTPHIESDGNYRFILKNVMKDSGWHKVEVIIRPGAIIVNFNDHLMLNDIVSESPLQTWDKESRLVLGNDLTGNRPWRGEISQATITAGDSTVDHIKPGMLVTPEKYWSFEGRLPSIIPTATSIRDVIQNIFLFVPMGVLLYLSSSHGGLRAAAPAVAAAGAISTLFEVLQIGVGRNPSVTDVLCNMIGALLGFLLTSALVKTVWMSRFETQWNFKWGRKRSKSRRR